MDEREQAGMYEAFEQELARVTRLARYKAQRAHVEDVEEVLAEWKVRCWRAYPRLARECAEDTRAGRRRRHNVPAYMTRTMANLLREVVGEIVERVIEEGIKAGRLGPRVDRGFVVQFEELTASPLEGVAEAVERLSRALAVASEQGWVTKAEARRMWMRYAGQVDESAPQGEGES